jgi:2-methylisocitrate lyase-like PEP mutase family enzyme
MHTVAARPNTRAVATASAAIAAAHGYEDGEQIGVDLMVDTVRRIVEAVDLPVTAAIESGYSKVTETVRRSIGIGVACANLEGGCDP